MAPSQSVARRTSFAYRRVASRIEDVWLKLEAESHSDDTLPELAEAHNAAIDLEADGLEGLEESAASKLELAGHAAVRTRLDYKLSAGRGTKILWTALDPVGRRALWLTAWGRSGNLEVAQRHIEDLAAGLRTSPTALPRTTSGPNWHRDHAFGFTLDTRRRADGSRFDTTGPLRPIVDETPPTIANISRILTVADGAVKSTAIALWIPGRHEPDKQLLQSFEGRIPARYRSRLKEGRRSLERVLWAGRETLLLRVGTDRMGADLRIVARGSITYAVLTEGPRSERERAAHWMELEGTELRK